MELLQLRYFYESAIHESFSKTAKSHMVPITSVSASIKRLEQELGCELFIRSSNRVHLSDSGKRFYESIRDMFADLNKALDNLKPEEEEKPIRILALDMRPVVTEWLIRFRELNPTVKFFMNTTRRPTTAEEYDVIIDVDGKDRYPGWEAIPLRKYQTRFCCSERNPISNKKLMLRDLANESFVGFEAQGHLTSHMVKRCREAGFEPRITAMCNDVRCYFRLLEAGVGIVLIKKESRPPDGTRYLDIVDFDYEVRLMAYHRPGGKGEKLNAFVDYIRRECADDPDGLV